MAKFLLHKLNDPAGAVKVGPTTAPFCCMTSMSLSVRFYLQFYLPPLPTIKPNPTTSLSSTFSSTLPHRSHVPQFRQRGPDLMYRDRPRRDGEDVYARVKNAREGEGTDESDELERMVEARREIYRLGLFAKVCSKSILLIGSKAKGTSHKARW